MMNEKNNMVVLFDFDGVVMDTEGQYSVFWNDQGNKHLNIDDFGRLIKGQTLQQIFDKYFSGVKSVQEKIRGGLDKYEENMQYEYLSGVYDFLIDLHTHEVKTALVTSSNKNKMANVYHVHPEIKELFDEILTAEYFTKSKPDPQCFLLGMRMFHAEPSQSYVFEDSFHGLKAGMDSGATVYGLATTNSREAIQDKAHYIIDDFVGMTYEKLIYKS